MQNLQIWSMNRTLPFYLNDLSIRGFWYHGSTPPLPLPKHWGMTVPSEWQQVPLMTDFICSSFPSLSSMTLPMIFNKYFRKTWGKGFQSLIGVQINDLEVKGKESSAILLLTKAPLLWQDLFRIWKEYFLKPYFYNQCSLQVSSLIL